MVKTNKCFTLEPLYGAIVEAQVKQEKCILEFSVLNYSKYQAYIKCYFLVYTSS